jgi:hypothetical protein
MSAKNDVPTGLIPPATPELIPKDTLAWMEKAERIGPAMIHRLIQRLRYVEGELTRVTDELDGVMASENI